MFTPFAFVKTKVSAAPAFSPSDISDLVGWWDAGVSASISGSTNQVTSWGDRSNTMGSFTKNFGTFAEYHSSGFGPNSMPYISGSTVFQATRYVTTNNWPAATSSSVFVVFNQPVIIGGTYGRFMESNNGYGSGFCWLDTDSSGNGQNMSVSSDLTTRFTPATGSASVVRLIWNGSTNKIKLNNNAETSFSAGVLTSQAANTLCLFNAQTSYNYGIGFDVAEIIIYNKVLNATELTDMSNYINTKYGLTI